MRWLARAARVTAFAAASQDITWEDPCAASDRPAAPIDHSVFNDILAAHVVQGTVDGVTTGLVDYAAIQADPSELRRYLLQLCDVDLDALTPAARLALLCNTYNALMIALVVAYGPQSSVTDVNDVWNIEIGTVAGRRVSLDHVEHTWIRNHGRGGSLSEAVGVQGRTHAGLVCASLSCPALYPFAFEGDTIVEQLQVATENWLANPTKNPGPGDGDSDDRPVILSNIYNWYGGDFAAESGSIYEYLRTYGPPSWNVVDTMPIDFAPYNWDLNKQPNTSHSFVSSHATKRGGRQFVSVSLSAATLSALVVFAAATGPRPL